MKKEEKQTVGNEKIYKKRISLTDWGGVFGMLGILIAVCGIVFCAYYFDFDETFAGSVLIVPLILFGFWTLIEIILAILSSVRIRGERVVIGRGKAFDLSELKGVTPVDGKGKPMGKAEKYRNPELVFHLNGDRTVSIRISYISGKRFDRLTEALGVRKL